MTKLNFNQQLGAVGRGLRYESILLRQPFRIPQGIRV
jgi:hypothetical protein